MFRLSVLAHDAAVTVVVDVVDVDEVVEVVVVAAVVVETVVVKISDFKGSNLRLSDTLKKINLGSYHNCNSPNCFVRQFHYKHHL